MQNVFVRPIVGADGNAVPVPDPQTGNYLQAAGEWKPRTVYWLRRIMFGDVVECAPAAAPAAAPIAPAVSYERQGTGFDSGAVGHELQGRASAPGAAPPIAAPVAPVALAPVAPAPAPAISTASVAANPETPLA